jgi:hypothetical protein
MAMLNSGLSIKTGSLRAPGRHQPDRMDNLLKTDS